MKNICENCELELADVCRRTMKKSNAKLRLRIGSRREIAPSQRTLALKIALRIELRGYCVLTRPAM